MRAMLWHQNMGGRFNDYLASDVYRANADRAIRAYFKGNPVMLGCIRLFPEMFIEQVKQLSYTANLGLFWEVMAPVFFEMSDVFDEGGFQGVPDAMNFLVNGIFAVAGRPIYHHVFVDGECLEIIPKSEGFTWLYEAALPYVEAVFYRTAPFRGTKSYNAQAGQVPAEQADFHYGILYADVFPVGSAGIPSHPADAGHAAFPAALPGGDLTATTNGVSQDVLIQLGVTSSAPCTTSPRR